MKPTEWTHNLFQGSSVAIFIRDPQRMKGYPIVSLKDDLSAECHEPHEECIDWAPDLDGGDASIGALTTKELIRCMKR